jgi:hypothetical protein
VSRHDDIHPGFCLTGDESKGEKVTNVQRGDKLILFIAEKEEMKDKEFKTTLSYPTEYTAEASSVRFHA